MQLEVLEVTRERLTEKTKTVAGVAVVAAERAAGAKVAAAGVAVVGSQEYLHSFIFKRHLTITFHY